MPNHLQTQQDIDERDLDRVKLATYVCAGVIGAFFALGVFLSFSFSMVNAGLLSFILFSVFTLMSTGLWVMLNVNSAKAIGHRRDPHLSFFVAGLNFMQFPFGTLLSWYTWKVLTRDSVQELYRQRLQGIAPPKSRKPSSIAADLPQMTWGEAVAHVDDAEEKLWKELEAKAKAKPAEPDKPDGPVRLVPGDD